MQREGQRVIPGPMGKHQGQLGDRSDQKMEVTAFIRLSVGKARQGRIDSIRLDSLNNSCGLWGIGALTGCLVPDPG